MPARVVWMTGLSGAGKTTLCRSAAERLEALGRRALVLDGDAMRQGLCADLGFCNEDRIESARRIAHTARVFAESGTTALVAAITPTQAARDIARRIVPDLIQVYVHAPLEVCESRDVKGLYAKARRGEIKDFTGIDAPFNPPPTPDIVCRTDLESIQVCTERILEVLGVRSHPEPVVSGRSQHRW